MLGSSASISGANIVLNTTVAESLKKFADILEQADDFTAQLHDLIQQQIRTHKHIIFNGNGYDQAWVEEAEKRGLLNLKTTPDCLPYFVKEKSVQLFTQHKVFSETEIHARYEILLENYVKTINIEALTMLDMARKDILPAISAFTQKLSETVLSKQSAVGGLECKYEKDLICKISGLCDEIYSKANSLEQILADVPCSEESMLDAAQYYKSEVLCMMGELRAVADEAETIMDRTYYPYPNYGDLLFGVQ